MGGKRGPAPNALYMLVSLDEYELPLIVCASAPVLPQRLGANRNAVDSAISKAKRRGTRCQYIKVKINKEDDET